MIDCGCDVSGFNVHGVDVAIVRGGMDRTGVWVGEHDPDGIECNGEEMSCKEKRGWCDPVRLRGVGVERARS